MILEIQLWKQTHLKERFVPRTYCTFCFICAVGLHCLLSVRFWFVWIPLILSGIVGSGVALLLVAKSKLRRGMKIANLIFLVLAGGLFAIALGIPLVRIAIG